MTSKHALAVFLGVGNKLPLLDCRPGVHLSPIVQVRQIDEIVTSGIDERVAPWWCFGLLDHVVWHCNKACGLNRLDFRPTRLGLNTDMVNVKSVYVIMRQLITSTTDEILTPKGSLELIVLRGEVIKNGLQPLP